MMIGQVEAKRTEPLYRTIKELPKDVLMIIFDRLSEIDLTRSRRVCRQWNVIGRDERLTRKFQNAFGASAWYRYFGRVDFEPPLPGDIEAIMNGSCPFWSWKKVYETHLLVLIPAIVNGERFTLDSLGEMIKKPKQGHTTWYRLYAARREHGSKGIPRGYWVLMTQNVLPGSRSKSYNEQKQWVEEHKGYEVPKLLEVVTGVLVEHVKTGRRLYSDHPMTWTRCQEQLVGYQSIVGGFSSGGLYINASKSSAAGPYGIGAARKL